MFKSDLFLRIDTSLWMSRSFTVTKALGKAPYGLEKFFITLIEEWIASGGAQFIKKESNIDADLANAMNTHPTYSPYQSSRSLDSFRRIRRACKFGVEYKKDLNKKW